MMNLNNSYWKLLVFYAVLLSAIVVLNFVRADTETTFADYFVQQLPKFLAIALAGTTLQFFLNKRFKKNPS